MVWGSQMRFAGECTVDAAFQGTGALWTSDGWVIAGNRRSCSVEFADPYRWLQVTEGTFTGSWDAPGGFRVRPMRPERAECLLQAKQGKEG